MNFIKNEWKERIEEFLKNKGTESDWDAHRSVLQDFADWLDDKQESWDAVRRDNYEFLNRRGIQPEYDEVCPACHGSGVRLYGSTATWRGGLGGQMITSDVCDKCWGSGKTNDKWVDLRKLRNNIRE